MKDHVLYLDLYNALHRARGGFQLGNGPILFQFMRSLRATIEQLKPSRMIAVSEGVPMARLAVMPEYKANRTIDPSDTVRIDEMKRFHQQKDICIDLLKRRFPISVVRHPDFEADDLLATLISRGSTAVPITVVSTDSDFTQLLCLYDHVRLYNPVKKMYVERPDHDYVTWKALRGDVCDNIPGIVSDARAGALLDDPDALSEFFDDSNNVQQFEFNHRLIEFEDITEDKLMLMESSSPARDWDEVRTLFDSYDFKSITNDKSWKKFTDTFDTLWNVE